MFTLTDTGLSVETNVRPQFVPLPVVSASVVPTFASCEVHPISLSVSSAVGFSDHQVGLLGHDHVHARSGVTDITQFLSVCPLASSVQVSPCPISSLTSYFLTFFQPMSEMTSSYHHRHISCTCGNGTFFCVCKRTVHFPC